MSLSYIHLSDIHFGQEKGHVVTIHDDAKARLIEDVAKQVEKLPNKSANGIIVTGDIAYGGKASEYEMAASWLDKVAAAARCLITDILVVPGNHDIDRDQICNAAQWQLSQIRSNGEIELDKFLTDENDRAILYARFRAYIPFAEAYNCSMDRAGGVASTRVIELASGRYLQFVGLNSALVCKKEGDKEGELLLGGRQRVLPIKPGHELVVLCHHPLRYLQDSADARRFVQSRARVFISGHEHTPSATLEAVQEGADLLMLAAGAAVPPKAEGQFTYTYNVIQFSCDEANTRLTVKVSPRAWDDEKKCFDEDPVRMGGSDLTYSLGCPNFQVGPIGESDSVDTDLESAPPVDAQIKDIESPGEVVLIPAEYPLVLLRFFRDLTDGQRLAVLVKLEALPTNWSGISSLSLARQIFDALVRAGRIEELDRAIKEIQLAHKAQGEDK